MHGWGSEVVLLLHIIEYKDHTRVSCCRQQGGNGNYNDDDNEDNGRDVTLILKLNGQFHEIFDLLFF